MAEALLERLSKKKIPKRNKPVQINIKGNVAVNTQIIDKTSENYDGDTFIQKLKERNLRAPRLFQSLTENKEEKKISDEPTDSRPEVEKQPQEKPEKITKRFVFLERKNPEKRDKPLLSKM